MDLKKVLLPTDFSKPAMELLDCLDEFQTLGLEEVILVHILDKRAKPAVISYRGFEQELLNNQKRRLEDMGLKVVVMLPIGIPNFEIVRIAREEQVSMILISSHGQGFIKNIFLGSTTNDVIRVSEVPVLIEKYCDIDKETCSIRCLNKFKKVLVPLDFSAHSRVLLHELITLSHLIEEVVLLSVIEGSYNDQELAVSIKDRGNKLNQARLDLEHVGLKVKTIVHQGSASTDIIAMSEEEDVTLIMLAKRGEGLIKELLIGGTAHAVAQRAQRPVLLFPVVQQ